MIDVHMRENAIVKVGCPVPEQGKLIDDPFTLRQKTRGSKVIEKTLIFPCIGADSRIPTCIDKDQTLRVLDQIRRDRNGNLVLLPAQNAGKCKRIF